MKNNANLHPITQTMRHSVKFFAEHGFNVFQGNHVTSERSNFDALNVPQDHPARDEHDTFWIKSPEKKVLRTHTTGSEINIIKENNLKPPFKFIIPGKCYRNERTDKTHEHTFYQIDGIMVAKNVNMSHLKGILSKWMESVLGSDVKTQFSPAYFPFVERSTKI